MLKSPENTLTQNNKVQIKSQVKLKSIENPITKIQKYTLFHTTCKLNFNNIPLLIH